MRPRGTGSTRRDPRRNCGRDCGSGVQRWDRGVRTACVVLLWCLVSASGCRPSANSRSQQPAISTSAEPIQVDSDPQSWRKQRPTPSRPNPLNYPAAERITLQNGFQVLAVNWQAPTTTLRAVCLRDADPKGQAGVGALLGRLMSEATARKSALQLAVAAGALGSNLTLESGRDALSFEMLVLPEDMKQGLALLFEVLTQPRLKTPLFSRIKQELLDDIAYQRQSPQSLAWLFGYRALLGEQDGRPRLGTPKQVEALRLTDVIDQYQRQIRPSRCGLLAAGPVSARQLAAAADHNFANWADATPIGVNRPPPAFPETPKRIALDGSARALLVDKPGSSQTSVWLGLPYPKRQDGEHESRQVLNNLFGGLFTSRLNSNLREKHAYTYGVFSTLLIARRYGGFVISTSVLAEKTGPAVGEVFKELGRLRKPNSLTAAELNRSKTDLVFSVAADLEHTSSIAAGLDEQFIFSAPLNYRTRYPQLIRELSAERVWHQATTLSERNFALVVVGDATKIAIDAHPAPGLQRVDLTWLE